MPKTLILIPSRMAASRLPGKPLLKINNLSIISHVVKKAKESKIGDVYVATEDKEIMEDVKKNGGNAILTGKHHKNGSERIVECFEKIGQKDIDYIINLQGDEPNINVEDLIKLNKHIIKNKSQIGTLAAKIKKNSTFNNPNIVKVITEDKITETNFPLALNFKRKSLRNKKQHIYQHIGVYVYKTNIVKKIVKLNQSKNEIKNNLEQLRAMDNGFKINVALAKSSPIGVDTLEDFIEIKKIMEYKSKL